jgi:Mg-chelatase subunit ChlD
VAGAQTPAFVAPPVRLADVHPDDPFWTNDLELGRPDLARMEVAFVVDATGSMDAVLGWLQRDVSRLMRALAAAYKDPPRVGVVFYRDAGGAFVTRSAPLTDRLKDLEPPLRLMTADGGGDVPEAVLDGLRAALGLGWTRGDRVGRRIILIGDAPPKPGTEPACEQAARAARDAGVRTLCVQVTTPDGRNDLSSFARIADAGGGAAIPVEFRRDRANRCSSTPTGRTSRSSRRTGPRRS